MNYGGILAGGVGARMGSTEKPKQYLELGLDGIPTIIYTLRTFVNCKNIDSTIIASHKDWIKYTNELIYTYFNSDQAKKIHVIEGGAERFESLGNICSFIDDTFGLKDNDILVSHDAVRPFLTEKIIDANIDAMKTYSCCDTVVPSTDTIVISEGGTEIDNIPLRKNYYQGQTPQTFRIKDYRDAFARLSEEQKCILTDACKVFTLNNIPVKLVIGAYDNMKITTSSDISVANAVLKDRA